MHPLLARQIAECTGPDGVLDVARFQALVGAAYADEERARARLDRAMRLMDEEMGTLNGQIARQAIDSVTRFILGASYPLLVIDEAGRILLANHQVGPALLCPGRDLAGRPVSALFEAPVDLESMAVAIDTATRVRRSDGTCFDATVTITRARVADRQFYIAALRDETERLEQMAAIEAARAAAESANRAKSAFLAMMSHELRTPLNALLGSADLLALTELDSRQASYVRMFTEAGQLMLALLNDVLDYSKIEAGQLELELAPFDPGAVLREVEALWGPHAASRGLVLRIETPPDLPASVLGDAMRLRQVLFNLVSNAIKFTAAGIVRVRAGVAIEGGVAALEVTVTDTGIGIPAERHESIFSPFVQADSSMTRRYGGTGLGLSIARSLARRMGGDLTVASRPGGGSAFTLTCALPLAQAPGVAAVESGATTAPELRVLAVDDNVLNRRILAAMLDLWPVSTVWATNGVEALAQLEQERFDVVLMDVQMPVMDGLAATRRLRGSDGPNRDVPVIALTANAREEDRLECLAAGMTDFLAKPVRPQALLEALGRVGGTAGDPAAPDPALARSA